MSKIIEKVRKLLELAGNNSNEHEAAAAIEKAHEILALHNLSIETVEGYAAESEDEERGIEATVTNYSEKYYAWVWNAVAKAHFCTMFSQRPSKVKRKTIMSIVGRRVNAVVAAQLAMYLSETMKRLANEAAKKAGRTDHAYKNAFIAGCAWRLCDRLEQIQKKPPVGKTSNALVVLDANEQAKNDAFLSAAGFNITQRKAKQVRHDFQGFNDGDEAGRDISLAQQLAQQKEARRLK
jgi:hypothetical protein